MARSRLVLQKRRGRRMRQASGEAVWPVDPQSLSRASVLQEWRRGWRGEGPVWGTVLCKQLRLESRSRLHAAGLRSSSCSKGKLEECSVGG